MLSRLELLTLLTLKAMSWEDFEQITKGFAELDKRLGFTKKHKNPISNRPIIVPFIDADSMEITIKDKHGAEHIMMEIVHKINTDMHRSVLFDTAGWTPKNTKLQQRAEKICSVHAFSFRNCKK